MKTKTIPAILISLFLGAAPLGAQPRNPEATAPGAVQEPGEVNPRSAPPGAFRVEPGELRAPVATGAGVGWKVAFWITATATVGLATGWGFAAADLVSLEDDKSALILAYRERTMDHYAFATEDVCVEAEARGDAGEIVDWCADGERRFQVNYVLLGLTIAGTIASGALLYRAYFHRPSSGLDNDPEPSSDSAPSPVRWMVTPSVSARGGGLGLILRF